MPSAALLLSGGVESTCIAVHWKPSLAITIDYGQITAEGEVGASSAVCDFLGIGHKVLRQASHGASKGLLAGFGAAYDEAHPEFWPFRNQLLLTLASVAIYATGIDVLMIGTVVSDAKFADGRPSFIDDFNRLLRSQSAGFTVEAPAIKMTSEELLNLANPPVSITGLMFFCHTGPIACGECPGCLKNRRVLESTRDPDSAL